MGRKSKDNDNANKRVPEIKRIRFGIARQIVIPFATILLLAGIFNSLFMFLSNCQRNFLDRKDLTLRIGYEATDIMQSYASLDFLVDYWTEHGEEMDHIFDEEQIEIRDRLISRFWPDMPQEKDVTTEELMKQSPEVQKLFAEAAYSHMCKEFDRVKGNFGPKYLYSLVLKDNNMYYLVTGLKNDEKHTGSGGDVFELADTLPYTPGRYPILDRVLATGEFTEQMDSAVDWYDPFVVHLFIPVYSGGKFVAVLGVAMEWSELFADVLWLSLSEMIVDTLIFAVLAIMLVIAMRKRVVIPINKTKNAIYDYETDKNSQAVRDKLSVIRSNNEVEELAVSFKSMVEDLDHYIEEIMMVTAEKERIGSELELASKIQADMLPHVFPPFPDREEFMLHASMDPAKAVGGDFYDYFFIDHDHIALVIADVSGKGIPAALFMTISMALLRSRARLGGDLSEIVADVNEQLIERNQNDLFVTVWMAIIDVRTGEGKSVNAGHEHPAICRKGGEWELVEYRHSIALGVYPGVKFRQREFKLNPGDRIFVYTDGVAEATRADMELYGTARMLEELNKCRDKSCARLINYMRYSIDQFVGNAEQFDDITMLAFQLNPEHKEEDE